MIPTAQLGQFGRSILLPSVATDPNFSNVVLLLHFDGTNGQTTTVDSSLSNHSITGTTTLVLSTAQVKFGTSSSDFSGAGGSQAWEAPDSSDWHFSTGQFTVEAWFYLKSSISSGNYAFVSQYPGSGAQNSWTLCSIGGSLSFYYSTTGSPGSNLSGSWSPSTGTWHHVAVDRDGSNVLRLYLNGAVVASGTVSANLYNATRVLYVGADTFSTRFPGYFDDVRITKGVARYAGAFTPPTAAFPNS